MIKGGGREEEGRRKVVARRDSQGQTLSHVWDNAI